MSDNIYNILNNFNKVAQGPQKPPTQSQPKAKTQLQESMDHVLAEKYMGFKKAASADKKSVEGDSLRIGSNLPQSDTETFGIEPGRGYKVNTPKDWKPGDRPRAIQQLIPTQDKKDHIRSRLGKHKAPVLPEGEVEESGLQAYLGNKKYGKDGMDALRKAGRDGASKEKMAKIRAKHDKMDEDGMPGAMSKEALAKRIYNLEMFIHRSDRTYAQAEPEAQAEVNKLKAQFAQQFPGEDAFKLGSAINDREYQEKQNQRDIQRRQDQEVATRTSNVMQKAKRGLGGMYEDKKPDFLDLDKDGNKAEPMKKAAKDAKSKKVQEVAPPGAKAERMVKHIKKGYAKDGKLSKTEKSKAYGAAWKAHNKGKIEEAVRAMFEAGFTKEQIVEGWDDMMKAVANRRNDMKPGEKRQGAKGEIEKTSRGIKHTRRYDRKTGETETGSDGQQVKRSRGRPKKSTFESSTTAKKMIAEHFREFIEGSIQGGVWTANPPKKGQPNVPVPQNIDGGSASPAPKTPQSPKSSAPKTSEPSMGSIKGGVWTAEPPKSGEKGVAAPSALPEDDMEEGNAFGGAVAKAKADGVQPGETIKVGGKTYPVKEGEELLQMLRIAGIKVLEDTQLDECGMSSMGNGMMGQHEQEGRMNVSTNMSSDGNKSVTITADGNSALELMQMLKLAGMGGDGEMSHEQPKGVMVVSRGDDEEELSERMPLPRIGADGQFDPGDMQKLQQARANREQMSLELSKQHALSIAKPETLKPSTSTPAAPVSQEVPTNVPEEEVDEAKDERYHANTTPEEHVMPVQVQTKGGDGDVAGREKKMTPHGYQFGDNPQAMKESMSLKLIKEYEAIKVKK